MRIAIDTGGTFTDIVFIRDSRLVVLKVFSTPYPANRDSEGSAAAELLRESRFRVLRRL